jgi:polar amino acid transport system substrate-binding protein
MSLTKKAFIIICAAAMIVTMGCAKKTKITIASDATWPPMEFIDANKAVVGFDVDVMNAVAKAGNFEIEIKNTAWDGIFAGLAAGAYDAVCSSVTITEERKGTMDFSKPYVNAGQVLFVKAEVQGIEKLDQLVGKKVGAQIGTTGAMEIKKVSGAELKEYDELGLAVEDLVNGRIEGVVADAPTAASFVLQNDNYKGKLKIVGAPFTEEYYGVAVKKGNAKILKLIDDGLDKIQKDGTLDKLQAKWLK